MFETPPYPSTHNLGTNRMSERPEDGVLNKWGQSHEVSDGSQFTTGAAENPTLNHRLARDPAGRPYRRPDGQGRDLTRRAGGAPARGHSRAWNLRSTSRL